MLWLGDSDGLGMVSPSSRLKHFGSIKPEKTSSVNREAILKFCGCRPRGERFSARGSGEDEIENVGHPTAGTHGPNWIR